MGECLKHNRKYCDACRRIVNNEHNEACRKRKGKGALALYYRQWRARDPKRHNEAARKWVKNNPDKQRACDLKGRYGITIDYWNELYKNGCWLCHRPFISPDRKSVVVEHDHNNKQIRGLAHRECNFIIAMARENFELLEIITFSLRNYYMKEGKENVSNLCATG